MIHPSMQMVQGKSFIPNDIIIGTKGNPSMIVVTGPNMCAFMLFLF